MAKGKRATSWASFPNQVGGSRRLTLEEAVKLYTEMVDLMCSFTPKAVMVKIDRESATGKIREGRPLLEREKLRLDFLSTTKLFSALCQLFKGKGGEPFRQVEGIEHAVARPRRRVRELIARVAKGEDDPRGGLLHFLLLTCLRPTFSAYAERLMPMVDQSLWMRSYCPICGAEPNLAELRGDERIRFLFCSLCGAAWVYPRLKCPFCQNEEPATLGHFAVEGQEDRHRVYFCLQCRRYLKTSVSPPQVPTKLPWYQDVSTIHLDLIALSKGYIKTPKGITG